MRLRRAPVPTFMILEANSTPIVWEERTRQEELTKRWRRQDLYLWEEDVRDWVRGIGYRGREGGGRGQAAYFPVPLGPRRIILAR